VVLRANALVEKDQSDAENRVRIAGGLLAAILVASIAASLGVAVLIIGSIVRPLREAVRAAQTFASGDLSASIVAQGEHEFAQLLQAMRDMQSNLVELVGKVRSGSVSVELASGEISQGNADLSIRTENQASALQTTAASMEELSAQVRLNADNAREANQLAINASSIAVQGGGVVNEVVDTMKGINQQSHKIAEIIGVIDGIAFQTNILALNAAVEAARAGEQGRGFAVVASEVRALAGRSADAAKEIKTLINASVDRVQRGASLVDQAGETMQEIVQSIKRVSGIVAEISLASSEQSIGVNQVGEAVTEMDQTTQQNAALVEEMASAAMSLKRQANELVASVSLFTLPAGNDFSANRLGFSPGFAESGQ
jgi:methyl-accepting chemotaxis protein-1 (serine sensor receptor)